MSRLVNDAVAVLTAVTELGLDAEQAEAVALLALVGGQDVEPGQWPGTWRIARKVANDRVISTVDPRRAIPARPAPTSATATRARSPPSPSPGW